MEGPAALDICTTALSVVQRHEGSSCTWGQEESHGIDRREQARMENRGSCWKRTLMRDNFIGKKPAKKVNRKQQL